MAARRYPGRGVFAAIAVVAALAALMLFLALRRRQGECAHRTKYQTKYQTKCPHVHIATIVTDTSEKRFRTLVDVATRHGTRINAITEVGTFGHGKGWGQRVRAMRRYLASLPPSDIAMFVDGYDVLINAPECEILSRFNALAAGRPVVVFNAESNCWPFPDLAAEYPPCDSPYKYLNGGGCIGRVDVFSKLLDTHMRFDDADFDRIDDQGEFTKIFLGTPGAIVLDSGNTIFNCMFGRESDLEFHRGRGWFNKVTKTYPVVFHANGSVPQKFLFDKIAPTMLA